MYKQTVESTLLSNQSKVSEFERDFNKYLEGTRNTKIFSLKDLVSWNKQHASTALPPGTLRSPVLLPNGNLGCSRVPQSRAP